MAELASETIVHAIAGDGAEVGLPTILNPAERALELSPDLRLKFRRSIKREVRKLKFRFLFSREVFRFQIFLIKVRSTLLHARCGLFRQLDNLSKN